MSQPFDAFVHKANISLLSKESIDEFRSKLREAVCAHMATTHALNSKTDDCWAAEVYGDSVIVCVYKNESMLGSSRSSSYYRVSYTRDKDGVFTFGESTKVKRTEVWTAVTDGVSIKKSLGDASNEEEFEKISKGMWKTESLFAGIL